jgi:tetratricopeptide (TPR) repeat protein
VAIAAAVYFLGPFRPGACHAVGTAEAAQKSIAVLSFQNLEEPGDPRGSAPIATSLLTVGLGESQIMPVLSAQRIHDVLRQMGKPNEIVKGAEALQVAGRAGAAYVVTGYIYATQPNVVLAAEVASTSDGTVLTACKVQTPGGERGLFAAVDSLTTALRDGLARAGFGVRQTSIDVAGLTTRNPAAYRAYVRGLDQLYRSKWTEADRAFRSAIAADSTFALAWYYSAVATWWNDDVESAKREVEAALRLGNRLSGRDRDGLKALGALIGKDYSGAARQYRELLDRYRDDKEFLYGLGEALHHGSADEAGALHALERATEIDPSFGVAYAHIVDIYIKRDDLDAALAGAERLLRADPENPSAYKLKSDVFFMRGDPEGAIKEYREALARDPEFVEALMGIGGAQGILGNLDSLRVAIAAISSTRHPKAWILSRGGEVFLRLLQGRFHEGEALAARTEKELGGRYRSNLDLFVVRFRARALLELGRVDEAIREYQTVTKAAATFSSYRGGGLVGVAESLARAGRVKDLEALLQEYDRMLQEDQGQDERENRNFIAGIAMLAKGRPREAVAIFEKNTMLGPALVRDWRRHWALARALLAAGEKDRAIAELVEVVKRAPGGGDPIETFKAINVLARLYEERGRRDEALTLYRRVAHQYRQAEPGVKANEEALAGIRRLSKAPS